MWQCFFVFFCFGWRLLPCVFVKKYRGKEVRIGNLFSPWEQFYCEIGGVLPCREGVSYTI